MASSSASLTAFPACTFSFTERMEGGQCCQFSTAESASNWTRLDHKEILTTASDERCLHAQLWINVLLRNRTRTSMSGKWISYSVASLAVASRACMKHHLNWYQPVLDCFLPVFMPLCRSTFASPCHSYPHFALSACSTNFYPRQLVSSFSVLMWNRSLLIGTLAIMSLELVMR